MHPADRAHRAVAPSRARTLRTPLSIALSLAFTAHAADPSTAAPATPPSASPTAGYTTDPLLLDRVEVSGWRRRLVGEAISASEGIVSRRDIASRPLLRTGDLLEFVPGLVATQHSGSGKANQYFMRGFNLDHGTDFSTHVDGMPVNMRSHGHGQGWTDLNFLIAETVESLAYRKGTYYADVGDFSSAGSARFRIADSVPEGHVGLAAGSHGYARATLVDSTPLGGGELLHAIELQAYDGPWRDIDEDVRKRNALLRYSAPLGTGRAHVMAMAYRNRWNAADQVPARAVASGLIREFGSLDTSVGGDTARSSLSGGWTGAALGGTLALDAYVVDSRLDLWSNFTYRLDDPVDGDQFQQVDDRRVSGFNASQHWHLGRSGWRVGVEGRRDDIDRVALLRTRDRAPLSTVRDDRVDETSLGAYVAHEFRFDAHWRSYLGLRHDAYRFDVDSSLSQNAGRARDGITSYKASLAYTPTRDVELYASAGTGFHSNDARGTTIRVDPASGEPVERADPLVESLGAELGARLSMGQRLQATVALWSLRLDSELLFVGDAGTTEASRPSRRRGVELGLYWFPDERYTATLEASYSRARFTDIDPAGDRIPGSIPLVVSSGLSARYGNGWEASAQLRHFGRFPLIEDASVRSDGSTLLNLRLGREFGRHGLHLDVLNALDSRGHDIDYFYASRLPGEPAEGVEDVHYTLVPARAFRLSWQTRF